MTPRVADDAGRGAARGLSFFALWVVLMPSTKPADLVVGAIATVFATWVSLRLLPPASGRVRFGVLLALMPLFPLAVGAKRDGRRPSRVRSAPAAEPGFRDLPAGLPARGRAQHVRHDHQPHAGHRALWRRGRRARCITASTSDNRSSSSSGREERLLRRRTDRGEEPWRAGTCCDGQLPPRRRRFRAADGGARPGARAAWAGRRRTHDGRPVVRHGRHRRLAARGRGHQPARGHRRGVDAGAAGGVRLHRVRQGRAAGRRRTGRGPRMNVALDLLSMVAVTAGGFFFLAGHRRPPAFSRYAHPPACTDQGRQPRPGTGGGGIAPAGRQRDGRAQAHRRLAARAPGLGDRLPAHRARGPAPGAAPMTDALNLVLVVTGPRARRLDDRRARDVRRGRRLHRLRTAADARLGATVGHRRGADRGGDRRRADRRVAHQRRVSRCGRPKRRLAPNAQERSRACWPRSPESASQRRLPPACSRCPNRRRHWRRWWSPTLLRRGVGNPITAVLMAFRAMDTLLEAIVLLLALIGVWSLGARPGMGRSSRVAARAPIPTASSPTPRGSCRRSGSSWPSTSSGPGRTSPAASSRAPRCWRRCGCWS